MPRSCCGSGWSSILDGHDVVPFDRLQEVADRIVELAKVNHGKLTR